MCLVALDKFIYFDRRSRNSQTICVIASTETFSGIDDFCEDLNCRNGRNLRLQLIFRIIIDLTDKVSDRKGLSFPECIRDISHFDAKRRTLQINNCRSSERLNQAFYPEPKESLWNFAVEDLKAREEKSPWVGRTIALSVTSLFLNERIPTKQTLSFMIYKQESEWRRSPKLVKLVFKVSQIELLKERAQEVAIIRILSYAKSPRESIPELSSSQTFSRSKENFIPASSRCQHTRIKHTALINSRKTLLSFTRTQSGFTLFEVERVLHNNLHLQMISLRMLKSTAFHPWFSPRRDI